MNPFEDRMPAAEKVTCVPKGDGTHVERMRVRILGGLRVHPSGQVQTRIGLASMSVLVDGEGKAVSMSLGGIR